MRKERVVILGLWAPGHVYPLLEVARALIETGKEVHVFSGDMQTEIEQTGCIFHSYSHKGDSKFWSLFQTSEHAVKEMGMIPHPGRSKVLFVASIPAILSMVPLLSPQIQEIDPTCIIYDSAAPWGPVLCHLMQMPKVCLCCPVPSKEQSDNVGNVVRSDEVAMKAIEIIQQKFDFKYEPEMGLYNFGDYNILMTSRKWMSEDKAYPQNKFKFWGTFALLERPWSQKVCDYDHEGLKEEVETREKKLVYLALGTIVCHSKYLYPRFGRIVKDFFNKVMLAVKEMDDVICVVAVGEAAVIQSNQLNGVDIPDNVRVTRFPNQIKLLEMVKATRGVFISHAGSTSVSEVLKLAEIPVLSCPFFGDQWKNADLFEKHGIGLTAAYPIPRFLKGGLDEISTDALTVSFLKHSLETLLSEQSFRESSRNLLLSASDFGSMSGNIADLSAFMAAKDRSNQ